MDVAESDWRARKERRVHTLLFRCAVIHDERGWLDARGKRVKIIEAAGYVLSTAVREKELGSRNGVGCLSSFMYRVSSWPYNLKGVRGTTS